MDKKEEDFLPHIQIQAPLSRKQEIKREQCTYMHYDIYTQQDFMLLQY